jgi:hypothetical protein
MEYKKSGMMLQRYLVKSPNCDSVFGLLMEFLKTEVEDWNHVQPPFLEVLPSKVDRDIHAPGFLGLESASRVSGNRI